jgi:hypothetical protein
MGNTATRQGMAQGINDLFISAKVFKGTHCQNVPIRRLRFQESYSKKISAAMKLLQRGSLRKRNLDALS